MRKETKKNPELGLPAQTWKDTADEPVMISKQSLSCEKNNIHTSSPTYSTEKQSVV